MRTCAGFDVPEFPKRSVIKFIMSRLANPEDWVYMRMYPVKLEDAKAHKLVSQNMVILAIMESIPGVRF